MNIFFQASLSEFCDLPQICLSRTKSSVNQLNLVEERKQSWKCQPKPTRGIQESLLLCDTCMVS